MSASFPLAPSLHQRRTPEQGCRSGTHFCLGAALARIELRVVLDALLDRVETVRVSGPVEWGRSNKHTAGRRLPVMLTPRARPASRRESR